MGKPFRLKATYFRSVSKVSKAVPKRRVKRGRNGGLLRKAACCGGGFLAGRGHPALRYGEDCRGGYQPPANPSVICFANATSLYTREALSSDRSLPQYRAAYEVAAAPWWDELQAKAV